MELEKASARLAPRSPWQAADLGTQFYRHWAGPITRVWLLFTAVPYALLLTMAALNNSLWPLFIFWWLKPLWERPLLAFYSHALFGETLTLRALLKRWRHYALPGLAGQLTWRRLSPIRSFNASVWQLEQVKGDTASQRLKVLNSYPSNRAGMLTLLVLHLEQFMTLGLMALLYMLVPWQFNLELSDWFYDQSALQLAISGLCFYLVLCITEPLYVACGFALYLNKRTWLEGWDLQLGLTRLGKRRRAASAARRVVGALLILLLVPSMEPAKAETAPPAHSSQAEQQQVIELLASPEFMPLQEKTERQWIDQDDSESESLMEKIWRFLFDNLDDEDAETNSTPLNIPDALLWTIFWALFIALALWLILKVANQFGLRGHSTRNRPVIPTHVAGLDIRKRSLPKNLNRAVDDALKAGDIRGALAILMRAALAGILARYPVALAAGSTEQQCLRTLQQHHGDPLPIAYLQRLTQAWISTAWAHRPVSDEQVRTLIQHWQQMDRLEANHA